MIWLEILFFIGLFILFYSYLGYGLLLQLLVSIKKIFSPKAIDTQEELPEVTLIVAAYNEQDFIVKKINNSLELDYPAGKLKLIFVTDGSSDETPALVARFPEITLLHSAERKGKVAAMHRAVVGFANTPYIVFSDANTLLNKESIKNIVRHYRSPEVGGVAGEKKILSTSVDVLTSTGEGLYWKYESWLKKLDSDFYSVVGAAGELFSVRKDLYEHPGDNILLDDFVISLRICEKGYRLVYEPDAFALEAPSSSIKEEQKRKARISAGAFQSMVLLRSLLNIFKFPLLSFQYISHRVLRWTLCPLFLPLVLILNIILVYQSNWIGYKLILAAQLLFYLMAFAGWLLYKKKIRISFFYVPYYFLFINISLYIGFFRFLKGNQSVLWEKAKREDYSSAT
ncbi:MAG: glycosyltransferase family 2 protein [Chitinophagaceae bacterium]